MEQELLFSARKCLSWIEKNMLAGERGERGVYERIRTDIGKRVNLCRPDVASEYLRALLLYRKTGKTDYEDVFENVTRWLEYAQNDVKTDKNSAFPFFLVEGKKDAAKSKSLYQNDNGKIILNLCELYEATGDKRYLTMSEKCAAFWIKAQRWKGNFYKAITDLKKKDSYGPCFILWLMAAFLRLWKITGKKKYVSAGKKAFSAARKLIKNGRMRTSFEVSGTEAWRPASSENYIALLCFALAYRFTGDHAYIDAIHDIADFCHSLIDPETGAIKNGTATCAGASLNGDENICDFVYTQGYAFNAMIELYEVLGEKKHLIVAKKAATFLIETQENTEDERTNGAWRGSYNIRTKKAEGQCDQNNVLNEGGKYSLYTGWCALPITTGLLRLYLLEKPSGESRTVLSK